MLTLDGLAAAIRSTSSEEPTQRLASLLMDWKRDDTSARDLASRMEQAIGNASLSTDGARASVFRLWSEFRTGVIDGIQGMTMNERLHWFGMFERFDEAATEEDRAKIYAKLHARP